MNPASSKVLNRNISSSKVGGNIQTSTNTNSNANLFVVSNGWTSAGSTAPGAKGNFVKQRPQSSNTLAYKRRAMGMTNAGPGGSSGL